MQETAKEVKEEFNKDSTAAPLLAGADKVGVTMIESRNQVTQLSQLISVKPSAS
jgi:hypothetical protein